MKPITDDVVQGLLKGLEMRERSALNRLNAQAAAMLADAGAMTSRVLRFPEVANSEPSRAAEPAELHDLSETRRTDRRRRTVSGLFLYSAQL